MTELSVGEPCSVLRQEQTTLIVDSWDQKELAKPRDEDCHTLVKRIFARVPPRGGDAHDHWLVAIRGLVVVQIDRERCFLCVDFNKVADNSHVCGRTRTSLCCALQRLRSANDQFAECSTSLRAHHHVYLTIIHISVLQIKKDPYVPREMQGTWHAARALPRYHHLEHAS